MENQFDYGDRIAYSIRLLCLINSGFGCSNSVCSSPS
jgi:hypothetical protein